MVDHINSENIIEGKVYIDGISAILFTPKEIKRPLPTIILYHGWSSNKEFQRMRGFILASVGYQVIIPDAIYHGERNPLQRYDMEDAKKYFWETILNNMEEAHIIIENLISKYNADPNKIGVMGHSMGGITAAGVFTHKPNIKALVVLNGSCGWENLNNKFKEDYNISMIEEIENVEGKVNQLDPQDNLDLLVDRPILLLNGGSDNVVPIESQKIFYNKIKPMYNHKDRIKFMEYENLGHFVTTNMMEEGIIWFNRFL